MNQLEKAALEHAEAWLQYEKSPQAKIDAERDKQRRAKADRTAGHLPGCSLLKCCADCR